MNPRHLLLVIPILVLTASHAPAASWKVAPAGEDAPPRWEDAPPRAGSPRGVLPALTLFHPRWPIRSGAST